MGFKHVYDLVWPCPQFGKGSDYARLAEGGVQTREIKRITVTDGWPDSMLLHVRKTNCYIYQGFKMTDVFNKFIIFSIAAILFCSYFNIRFNSIINML